MDISELLSRLRAHRVYPLVLRSVLVLLCLILLAQVTWILQGTRYGSLGAGDFIQYWSSGQLLLEGRNPYDPVAVLPIQRELGWPHAVPLVMWNPPWLLAWMLPLAMIGFPSAVLMWLATNLAIILLCSVSLWSFFAPEGSGSRTFLVWIAAILFAPALMTLGMGQVSGLNLLGVSGFLLLVRRNHDFGAGILLALTTVKPHLLFLWWLAVLWFVVRGRRWRILWGCSAMLGVSTVILTLLRPSWIQDYVGALRSPPLYWATPTIGGVLRELLHVPWQESQYLAPAVAAGAVILYLFLRRPSLDWKRAASPLILFSVIAAPFGWSYDQIVLLVPYLQMLVWVAHSESYSRLDRGVILSGLVLYSGGLFVMNLLYVDELYKFWLAWLLGACFLFARRRAVERWGDHRSRSR